MPTALRPASLWVCWLHYFLLTACNGERKAGDFRDLNQRKTSNTKENPHHSNNFWLNCMLLSQSNPPGAVYLYLCGHPENNAPLSISSWGTIFPKQQISVSPNHCCHSTRSSTYKCQGLWEILTHHHVNELSQDISLNHLKLIQTSYLNMKYTMGTNRLRGKRKFKLLQMVLHSI